MLFIKKSRLKLGEKPKNLRKSQKDYFKKKENKIAFFTFCFSTMLVMVVIAAITLALGGGAGPGDVSDDDEVTIVPCADGATVCYVSTNPNATSYSGYSWVYVPNSTWPPHYSSAGPFINKAPGSAATTTGDTFDGAQCGAKGAKGYYVTGIFRYYHATGVPTGDMKGPFLWSYLMDKYHHDSGASWSDGSYTVDNTAPENALEKGHELGYDLDKIWSVGNFSAICAWDTIEEEPEEITVDFCSGASVTSNAHYGDTKAKSEVRNLSAADISWKSYVIGKPGDTVMFCHSMSYGNRFVGSGLDPDIGTHFPPSTQSYKIVGVPDDPAYAFPAATYGSGVVGDGSTRDVAKDNVGGDLSTIGEDKGVRKGSYYFTILSPYYNDNYACDYPPYNPYNRYKKHGFQISGTLLNLCNASPNSPSYTGKNSEAGKTFAQHLHYTYTRAWDKYGHKDNRSCGCNYRSGEVTNQPEANSYITSPPGGNWGWAENTGPANSTMCPYSGCCCSSYTCGTYHNECCCNYSNYPPKTKGTITYKTTWEPYVEKDTANATVYVPYNFNTTIDSDMPTKITYQGSTIPIGADYKIVPRSNPIASTKNPTSYATITPAGSHFRVYELLLPENYNKTKIHGSVSSSKDVCEFYGISTTYCNKLYDKSGPFNPNGLYEGHGEDYHANRVIPDNDYYVGWKYCVAASIFPASSHTSASNSISNNTSGAAFSESGNNKYNVSGLSCVTIAKKPTVQVWGGGIFTNGSIKTANTKKYVQKSQTNPIFSGSDSPSGIRRVFTSWEEFAIIAGNTVEGMSSGAISGYGTGYNFPLRSYNNVQVGVAPGASMESVSTETIQNASSPMGNSGIPGLNSNLLARLKARYRDEVSNHDSSDAYVTQDADTGTQFIYKNGSTSLSSITTGLRYRYTKKDDGTVVSSSTYCPFNHCTFSGNTTGGLNSSAASAKTGIYKNVVSDTLTTQDNTLIIYVKGKLTIDRNICYSATQSECDNGAPAKLNSYNLSTQSIAALPQVLIFAQEIEIAQNVDRVEAWLILDENAGNGQLKTCNISAPNHYQCSKTLVITGPVFAKKLVLSRSAGARNSLASSDGVDILNRNLATDGSSAPAEIFNLRSDAYYWSYGQAQRSTEAVTTYLRELAPRY